jgi:O-methyltransferase involved in polyketide biosynthesis
MKSTIRHQPSVEARSCYGVGNRNPAEIALVPVDFYRETFTERIVDRLSQPSRTGVHSLVGGPQYLSSAAALATLREIAEMAAAGSEMVFQFVAPSETLADEERSLVMTFSSPAATSGELWLSFFEPEGMEAHLKQTGFRENPAFRA